MRRTIVLALLLLVTSAAPAKAGSVVFTDDFSGGFDWQLVRNAAHFDPAISCNTLQGVPQWQIIEDEVEMHIAGSFPCSTEIVPKTEAVANLRAFRMKLKMFVSEPKMDRNILVRWKDADNQLGFHFFGEGIYGYKNLHGRVATLQNPVRGYTFSTNRWYDISVDYDLSRRSIRLFINGQFIIEMSEPPDEDQIDNGKPGLAASVGEVDHSYVRFDDFQVESLESGKKLAVPLYLQRDPRWKDDEYDTASQWAPDQPTIGRWGCALTSGVMVLRYHGIDKLPDGTDLDPESLNTWLIKEPDGYYPGGGVNWRALTRLSLVRSQAAGSTKLEMTYADPEDQLGWLKQQIDAGRAPILAEPGHFIAAYGYGPGEYDRLIHDPFYDRYRLSDYAQSFDSARLFTPSNTDLSALTVIAPLGTMLSAVDQNGLPLSATTIIESGLADPTSGKPPTGPRQIFDLPKPAGRIFLVLGASDLVRPVWIAAYNLLGEVSLQSALLPASSQDTQIPIDFSSGAPKINLPALPISLTLWDLTRLSLSQELRSPALVSLILDYQAKTSRSDSLDEALAIERGFQLRLSTAAKNGWISALWNNLLAENFRRLILEKYP